MDDYQHRENGARNIYSNYSNFLMLELICNVCDQSM